ALGTFCNDMTMGSAWASCLDIGKRYSGIVSGCMNTVGNLGGALAGVMTGRILDSFTQSARQNVAAAAGSLVAASAVGANPSYVVAASSTEWERLSQAQEQLRAPSDLGWQVNFFIFGLVYVGAVLFWLGFDSTKPVVPDKEIA